MPWREPTQRLWCLVTWVCIKNNYVKSPFSAYPTNWGDFFLRVDSKSRPRPYRNSTGTVFMIRDWFSPNSWQLFTYCFNKIYCSLRIASGDEWGLAEPLVEDRDRPQPIAQSAWGQVSASTLSASCLMYLWTGKINPSSDLYMSTGRNTNPRRLSWISDDRYSYIALAWDLKPNSWTYNFIEISGHNLESSQTWGVCMDFIYHREVGMIFYQVFLLSPLQKLQEVPWIWRNSNLKAKL